LEFNVEQLKACYRRQVFYHTEITIKINHDALRQVDLDKDECHHRGGGIGNDKNSYWQEAQ
jgi:hypothetical protein